MSRLQLALRVSDLDRAVPFYEQAFATTVTKRRPGYANFAIADPPLKLVLIEGSEGAGELDHLGVETMDGEELAGFQTRWDAAGITDRVEEHSACCYATQDKSWTRDPDGLPWEVYRVVGDAEILEPEDAACCTSDDGSAQECGCAA